MNVTIYPSVASGSVVSKASKSSMQRAIVASLLANGRSTLSNICYSDDSRSALKMAECLGATILTEADTINITGGLKPICTELNCGESGLGVRMFAAISSLSDKEITLSGSGSILNRPMNMIEDSLRGLGASVVSNDGYLPVKIKGPIKGGVINIDGSFSSQLISGLLFALPLVSNDSKLIIDSLKSKPYIDLSISVLQSFGIDITNKDYKEILVKGNQQYSSCNYRVEEDWSGISFLAVLGAISGGRVVINDLSHSSKQADRAIVGLLESVGASVIKKDKGLIVEKSELRSFSFDITDCPDLAPPLVALATFCNGRSEITGTSRLEGKESNRSLTLKNEFDKLGVKIDLYNDSMVIHGGNSVKSGEVSSCGDHRIAMALALAGSSAKGPVRIKNADVVNKSYPDFFDDIEELGITIKK